MPGAPTTSNIDGHETDSSTHPDLAPPGWEIERVIGVWAVVEIMGHKVRAGSVSDATIGGAVMLRVQHPTVPDHENAGPLTEYYAASALFSVRPVDRATATEWAEARWRPFRSAPAVAELEAAADVYIEDAYDDEDPSF